MAHGEVLEFEEYVRTRQDALLRSARRLVPDPVDAQDLLQTALVRTYGCSAPCIADKRLADAYLRRVMINTRTEWWRARKLEEVPPSSSRTPASTTRPSSTRHGALLMDIMKFSLPSNAASWCCDTGSRCPRRRRPPPGMSAGTVKSTLHRALARLREELESRDLDARALEREERERCAA